MYEGLGPDVVQYQYKFMYKTSAVRLRVSCTQYSNINAVNVEAALDHRWSAGRRGTVKLIRNKKP